MCGGWSINFPDWFSVTSFDDNGNYKPGYGANTSDPSFNAWYEGTYKKPYDQKTYYNDLQALFEKEHGVPYYDDVYTKSGYSENFGLDMFKQSYIKMAKQKQDITRLEEEKREQERKQKELEEQRKKQEDENIKKQKEVKRQVEEDALRAEREAPRKPENKRTESMLSSGVKTSLSPISVNTSHAAVSSLADAAKSIYGETVVAKKKDQKGIHDTYKSSGDTLGNPDIRRKSLLGM